MACYSAFPDPSSTTNLDILIIIYGEMSYPEFFKLSASWHTVILSLPKGYKQSEVFSLILLPICFWVSGGKTLTTPSINLSVLILLLKSWNVNDFMAYFISKIETCLPIELVLIRACGSGSFGPFLLATCSSKRPVL